MVTVAKSFEAPIKCKLSKQRERERERERESFHSFSCKDTCRANNSVYNVLLHL